MFNNVKLDLRRYRHQGRIDWSEPSIPVIMIYRFGQVIRSQRFYLIRLLMKILHTPLFIFFTLLTGIHLPRSCKIGPGMRIYHFGCIVVNPDTVIGSNCTLRHGVTIGNRQEEHDVPVLGDHVDIGAGAKILGRVHIGNNVSIGANAVVLCDVPDNHIAVGVPAKVLPKRNSM